MCMSYIKFTAYGVPVPKGSKTGFIVKPKGGKPRAIVTDQGAKRQRPWIALIQDAARKVCEGPPTTAACGLTAFFYFPRPKSHFRTGKNAGLLRESAPDLHTQKPDLGKLVRLVEDALTGIVWKDDAQVFQYTAGPYKGWINPWDEKQRPRAEIEIGDWTACARRYDLVTQRNLREALGLESPS